MTATAASDRMNIVSLKTINHQQQQQHNCMPSNAGSDDNTEAIHVVATILLKVKN